MDRRGLDGAEPLPRMMSAEQAFALLPFVLAAVNTAEWWRCGEAELAGRVQVLGQVENQVVAAQVTALGEAVSRGLPTREGFKSGAAWLRGLVPVTPYTAMQRAVLAERLPSAQLAPTRQAFVAGAIAAGHAAVVTRTMSALDAMPEVDAATSAEAQEVLVAEAGRIDPAQLGRLALHLRNRLDPEGPERLAKDEEAQQEARSAIFVQESTGMWFLTASLPPLDGAMLAAALDPLAAPQPADDGSPDPRTAAQRRADALTGLAELSMSQRAGQPDGLPSRHGSPVRLVVTADKDTLLADLTRRGGQAGVPPATVETGERVGWDLSPLTAQMLACDAEIVPMLLDDTARPLDVGESQYRFPSRIRRAIEARDRHCTFPRCQAAPAWCHAHHLIPFGRNGKPGGPTSEANGTLLCGRHDRHVHASGWTGRLVDGHVTWQPPRPGAPPEPANSYARQFETKLRQLALRWLERNPELRDTS